jgi:pimeloyl-ACP methyl ester carboxylesterase
MGAIDDFVGREARVTLEVRRFGRGDREMVGILVKPAGGAVRRPAFLLCRPIGQEATRAASMYRVIAERLARQGTPVLVFDYHGTGDSPGEECEQGFEGWITDIEMAHELLGAESAGGSVHWFAMSVAANLALRAAARVSTPPAHLLLWEPAFDGPGYLAALLAAHRRELVHEYHLPWAHLLRQGRVTEPAAPGDVLGFHYGEALTRDLQEWRTLPLSAALRRGTGISCGLHAEDEPRLRELRGGASAIVRPLAERTHWMLSQAMGTALVPQEVLPALNGTYAS